MEDEDIDRSTEAITSYMSFRVDSIIPQRTVKRYLNNKPYVTREINKRITRKNLAFKLGDKARV